MTKRAGRPRKSGERYPSGNLRRRDAPDADARRAQAGLLWRRLMDDAVTKARDPRVGSQIGRLTLLGVLTDAEAASANYIAEVIGRYERLSGAPRRSAASPSFTRGYAGSDADDDPYKGGDPERIHDFERAVTRARAKFTRLIEAMPSARIREAVYDLCVDDRHVGPAHHAALKHVLAIIGRQEGFIAGEGRRETRR